MGRKDMKADTGYKKLVSKGCKGKQCPDVGTRPGK